MIEQRIDCSSVARFVEADNTTWTKFLAAQVGFARKLTLTAPREADAAIGSNCSVYTMTLWLSRQTWAAIPGADVARTAAAFAKEFGYSPKLDRIPTSLGYDAIKMAGELATRPPRIRVPAVGGNDVVAYHTLEPGGMDVPGLPSIVRYSNSHSIVRLLDYNDPQRIAPAM